MLQVINHYHMMCVCICSIDKELKCCSTTYTHTYNHRPTPDRHMLSGNSTQASRIYCMFDGGTFLHVFWPRRTSENPQIVKMRAMHRPPRRRFVFSARLRRVHNFRCPRPITADRQTRASPVMCGCIQIDGNRDGCSGHAPDGRPPPVTTSIMLIKL